MLIMGAGNVMREKNLEQWIISQSISEAITLLLFVACHNHLRGWEIVIFWIATHATLMYAVWTLLYIKERRKAWKKKKMACVREHRQAR